MEREQRGGGVRREEKRRETEEEKKYHLSKCQVASSLDPFAKTSAFANKPLPNLVFVLVYLFCNITFIWLIYNCIYV